MSSGFIQLAALGQQDVYLTGTPDLTYYSGVYKRHSAFSLEAFEIPFKGNGINMGQTNIVNIPVKGDLIRATTLKLSLPPLAVYGGDWFQPFSLDKITFVIDDFKYSLSTCKANQPYSSNVYSMQQWAYGLFMSYDQNSNKFTFQGTQIFTQESTAIFLGFDILNPVSVDFESSFPYEFGNVPDFTLEQAGWIKSPGLYVDTQQDLILRPQNNTYPPPKYVDLSKFIKVDEPTNWTITPGGRFNVANKGTYTIRASFRFGVGSSFNPLDGDPIVYDTLKNSISGVYTDYFDNTYPCFYIYSYGKITPSDYIFIEQCDSSLYSQNPFTYSKGDYLDFTIFSIYGEDFQPDTNTSFNVRNDGYYLMSCVFESDVPIISVDLLDSSEVVLMSIPCYNTTITNELFFPVSNSITFRYSIRINTNNDYILQVSSFINLKYLALAPDEQYPNGGFILPLNGLLFQGFIYEGRIDFNSLRLSGVENFISYYNSYITFNQPGTYVLTSNIPGEIGFSNVQYNFLLTLPAQSQNFIRIDTAPITLFTSYTGREGDYFLWFYPATSPSVPNDYKQYHYYDSVGTWAIENAELKIGGQTIQKLEGEAIEIWNDLNVPYENQPALSLLTGKNDTSIAYGRDYYVNLPFYFYGNSGSYLPISILNRQDVEIWVTLRPLQSLTSVQLSDSPVNATLIVEYVYLTESEIKWMSSATLEYVIDQYQYNNFEIINNGNFEIIFENPISTLFFVIQVEGSVPYDWSNDSLKNFGIKFNGEDIVTKRLTDSTQLGVIEPFENFVNFPSRNFYMKVFNNPINFSRIRQVLLDIDFFNLSPVKQLRVTAVSKNVLRISDGLGGLMFISP